MRTRKVMKLGELVALAFDAAARRSKDPKQVSRLATSTVLHLLRTESRPWLSRARAAASAAERQGGF